ncbi:hypothetical protein OQA88_8743 [Cercophora sp. LCS_1]
MMLKAATLIASGAALAQAAFPVRIETRSEVTSRVANVHLSFSRPINSEIEFTYGPCSSLSPRDAHHTLGRADGTSSHAKRLVWVLPDGVDSGGCISAWDADALVGRSEPQILQKRHERRAQKRAVIEMTQANGFDTWGPWFEGVSALQNKDLGVIDVEAAKSKDVAIVGAGMSGLMSWLVLHQAGMTNLSIIEAGNRLGGRVHTEYLSGGPFDYSYQEMGPMRFPATYKDPATNETLDIADHQLVFQLAAEMNKLNVGDKNFSVDFIPWIQSNRNGLVYRNGFKLDNGLPPTSAQISANSSLGSPASVLDESTINLSAAVDQFLPGSEFGVAMAKNMFKAHKDWIVNGLKGLGGDSWSEFAFMTNYLRGSLNSTDMLGGMTPNSFWDSLYEGLYFSASSWRTIDGGLSRLPLSFHPHVDSVTTMSQKITRVTRSNGKINLHTSNTTSTHDYALLSPPFSILRQWRLPSLPPTISNAINRMPYTSACKVALEYSQRFWEQYSNPIVGGCSTTSDIPGIGSICYPSYDINGTGKATILASYISGDWGVRWLATSEEEHVKYVVDAMVEIHGQHIRELWTGKYSRVCWALDPLESGSWASPETGMHELYGPEFFRTYEGLIFIGEHTSYTHAWIASALESGIRGAVQLLLELGLVDEAKEAVNKWMARWIDI